MCISRPGLYRVILRFSISMYYRVEVLCLQTRIRHCCGKSCTYKGSFLDRCVPRKQCRHVMQCHRKYPSSYHSIFCQPDISAAQCTHNLAYDITCLYYCLAYNSSYRTAMQLCRKIQVHMVPAFFQKMGTPFLVQNM